MKNKIIIFLSCLLTFLSCKSDENKIEECKNIVQSFMLDLQFQNGNLNKYYPKFAQINPITKISNFKIVQGKINEDRSITIYGTSGQNNYLFLLAKDQNNDYKIINSRGLTNFYNQPLYKLLRKIDCIDADALDLEISEICKKKLPQYKKIIAYIKEEIEKQFYLSNQKINNNFGTLSLDYDIFYYGKYKLAASDYEISSKILDEENKVVYSGREGNNIDLTFGNGISTYISQNSFPKKMKLKITSKLLNTKSLENQVYKKVKKNNNCNYFENINSFVNINNL